MPRLGNEIELYLADGAGSGGFEMAGCSTDLQLNLANDFFQVSDMTPDAFKLIPTFTTATISGSALFETIADSGKLTSQQLLDWCNEKILLDWRIITNGLDIYGECYFASLDIVAGNNQVAMVNFTLNVSGKVHTTSGAATCPIATGVTAAQDGVNNGLVEWSASGTNITGFVVRLYTSLGVLVTSATVSDAARDYTFGGLADGNYYATVQTLCLADFSNETTPVSFSIDTLEVWGVDSGSATSATGINIFYGNNGDTPSTPLYSGLFTSNPLTGTNAALPANNLNAILTVTTSETLISATLNGVAGSIGGNTASWSGITGSPLEFSFEVA